MIAMLRERADWCISRQRRWGMPIPVFYCKHCGKPICTEETIAHISRLFGESGSNIWFQKEAMELIPEGLTCPHCGGKDFEKETDTLDGWFDSGSTHFASLYHDNAAQWPADVYLEGADQYRGWFQSSLLTAVGALEKGAPFRQVLTHGWTVDGEGRAMHKSLGNGMDPNQLIKEYGADIVRLWAGASDYHADVRCSKEIFKQLSQNYLKFRNTARYCLGNLEGFDPNHLVEPEQMPELDRWALTKLERLIAVCRKAYDRYEFHVVSHAINDFCVVELSSFYLDIIKDRLYCEDREGLKRRSAQTALYLIVDAMAKLFAPILAFTCDEIWQAMPHRAEDDPRNILLNRMPESCGQYAPAPGGHGEVGRGDSPAPGCKRRAGGGPGGQTHRQGPGGPCVPGSPGRCSRCGPGGGERTGSGGDLHCLQLRPGAGAGRGHPGPGGQFPGPPDWRHRSQGRQMPPGAGCIPSRPTRRACVPGAQGSSPDCPRMLWN